LEVTLYREKSLVDRDEMAHMVALQMEMRVRKYQHELDLQRLKIDADYQKELLQADLRKTNLETQKATIETFKVSHENLISSALEKGGVSPETLQQLFKESTKLAYILATDAKAGSLAEMSRHDEIQGKILKAWRLAAADERARIESLLGLTGDWMEKSKQRTVIASQPFGAVVSPVPLTPARPEAAACSKCSAQMPAQSRFCPQCGHKIQ
jgi:hypothetical protein